MDTWMVANWLRNHELDNCIVQEDGTVNSSSSVSLWKFKGTIIPVQFGTVNGYFDISASGIEALDGIPHTIYGSFALNNTRIKSLSGIDKNVKLLDGRVICPAHATHILGLLLIPGVTAISIEPTGVEVIMNRHLRTGDILSAQDELIDAGYVEQARL